MPQPLSEVELLRIAVKAQRQQIKKLRKRLHAAKAERDAAKRALDSMPPDHSAWSEVAEPSYDALVEMLEDIPRGLRTLDEVMQHVHDATVP